MQSLALPSIEKVSVQVVEWILRDGHRRRGRLLTQRRNKIRNFGGREWTRLAQDRSGWRSLGSMGDAYIHPAVDLNRLTMMMRMNNQMNDLPAHFCLYIYSCFLQQKLSQWCQWCVVFFLS